MRMILIAFLLFSSSACSSKVVTQHQIAQAETSPKPGWGEFQVVEKTEPTIFTKILLWIPNRVVDLIDVFRVDVGVGPAFGGVVRISEHFQAGYRSMEPMSFRLGDFGRDHYPVLLESSNEFGVSPAFVKSKDRTVCGSEIGVGADVLIVGAYAGICVQELADFIAGIFFLDLNDDDWE